MGKHYTDKEIEDMGEELNRIFTAFQKLDKKLASWTPLSKNTNDKWEKILSQQQINALTVQIELSRKQISEMQKYTKWFIGLTITIIAMSIINIILRFGFW